MKERPIIFSGAMVNAILDGRKTQTRRVVKPQTDGELIIAGVLERQSPYGAKGDRLWVRETWRESQTGQGSRVPAWYKAHCGDDEFRSRWKPSIFMPRWASRITLEVVSVRVERLRDISEDDAIAEGVGVYSATPETEPSTIFARLWDSINGKKHPWESNPWVWVIDFRKVKP